MSAVQIFCGDRMAVVAHLVGVDQLGYEKAEWRPLIGPDHQKYCALIG